MNETIKFKSIAFLD